eukprot:127910-Pleurochrysis_carterae.AAC.2
MYYKDGSPREDILHTYWQSGNVTAHSPTRTLQRCSGCAAVSSDRPDVRVASDCLVVYVPRGEATMGVLSASICLVLQSGRIVYSARCARLDGIP